jgi:3-oxoacyl-[acyl-carrier protein] reductase
MARPLALVTGGTSGIGLGVARALAAEHDLALGYRADGERAGAARAGLARDFPAARVEVFAQPLLGYADARALVARVGEAFAAPPLVLVHSAGRVADRLFLDGPFELHAERLQEHLVAAMALAHLLLGGMYRARRGRVILLGSIGARYVKRGQAGYAAAKAGLEGFARALALEVAHRGVTVNVVAPGLVATPMTEAMVDPMVDPMIEPGIGYPGSPGSPGSLPAAREAGGAPLRRRIPAGRMGEPEDVGALVRFLCSPAASYITGAVIPVDGGRSLGDAAS